MSGRILSGGTSCDLAGTGSSPLSPQVNRLGFRRGRKSPSAGSVTLFRYGRGNEILSTWQ
ncbi:hypothetical protein [Reticulibacter mediterranei]|uniref:hypothetical protein n=1 Tax=Reticulibacter mediterranei TaxID=2778369 RepID=UPI001C69181D|nr:hypothetical protein [Reticulibacter mediterranei]